MGLLRFVYVDEAHLFVHYDLYFRQEFIMFSATLFSPLLLPDNCFCTKIPVMFMTATCTRDKLHHLQQLSDLRLPYWRYDGIFWPTTEEMINCAIMIIFILTAWRFHFLPIIVYTYLLFILLYKTD